MSAFRTPLTRALRRDERNPDLFGFSLVLEQIDELPVGPLVKFLGRWCPLTDMRQVLDGDNGTAVVERLPEDIVSNVVERLSNAPAFPSTQSLNGPMC